jgi:hypothetical protein
VDAIVASPIYVIDTICDCALIDNALLSIGSTRIHPRVVFTLRMGFQHLGDLWNAIDWATIATGIAGSHYRFASLQHCSANHRCNRESMDSVKASCLLAVTAVLLWSKVMYFLTPWMAAGKLGKYLALCVCVCVLLLLM